MWNKVMTSDKGIQNTEVRIQKGKHSGFCLLTPEFVLSLLFTDWIIEPSLILV
jgi:hypothetical protein